MIVREPIVAGSFYAAPEQRCLAHIEQITGPVPDVPDLPDMPVGGIVPHAGWDYSGRVAMEVFLAIRQRREPATFVLFGSVHAFGVGGAAMFSRGLWETPIGSVPVDERLANAILEETGDMILDDVRAHENEHSIEVQVPLIKRVFPDARIVPIAVPPGGEPDRVGREVAGVVRRMQADAVFVGTTDLTHYGANYGFTPQGTGEKALEWVKNHNDKRMVDLIVGLDAKAVCAEAGRHHNACGPGAVAATLAAAREMGATRGHILTYTTSNDVMVERFGSGHDSFVGYVGAVF
ncbi:MAG: AmmeMemoRadiSam system protein B [Planctomycetia bacterium]|nr:AmmeMemoRadiSam system protein B [Planctomycetia bacterium]